jgi:hypothetical protein
LSPARAGILSASIISFDADGNITLQQIPRPARKVGAGATAIGAAGKQSTPAAIRRRVAKLGVSALVCQ